MTFIKRCNARIPSPFCERWALRYCRELEKFSDRTLSGNLLDIDIIFLDSVKFLYVGYAVYYFTSTNAKTPILWPPHVMSWLIGKDPDAGRDWGQEEKGMTEDEMAG